MRYKCMPLGELASNCYLVWCPVNMEGIVVDPGFESQEIPAEIQALGLSVKYIVNTHGHVDHIGGNRQIQQATSAPIAVGSADADWLTDETKNLSVFMGAAVTSPVPEVLLQQDDLLEFGACSLKVLSTPGHTPGGICLYGGGLLFSGDTLFKDSIGRTDLPGGDHRQLLQSLETKILPLPGQTKVLPGHGPASTLDREKAGNPWLRRG